MSKNTFRTYPQVVDLKVTGKRYEVYRATGERGMGRLGVEVSNTGTKRWLYRYFFEGQRKYIRLGLVSDNFVMTQAQAECDQYAELLGKKIEPKVEIERLQKQEDEAKKVEGMKGSIQQLFIAYTDKMETDGKRTYDAVLKALEKEVYPFIEPETKAKEIQPTDIIPILSTMIQRGAIVQSNRVRSYIVAAFNFGLKHDLNPAQVHTGVKFGLTTNPAQVIAKQSNAEKVGENWLTIEEVKIVLNTFKNTNRVGPLVSDLMSLCFYTGGQRPYELVASRWSSINWEEATLLVTSVVSKNKRPHLIPLTEKSISILSDLHANSKDSEFIFPRRNDANQHLRTDSFSKAIARFREDNPKFNPFVARDIRRTCKTLMGELGISKEIRDRLQNHALNDVSSKHYDRYSYLQEKKDALRKWENKLTGSTSKVVNGKFRGIKHG
jgi:integrase